jgi:hypothetical protein
MDYEPVFRDVPTDWQARWRLLRTFVERWYKVSLGDVSGPAARARETEERLGYLLPPSVREWAAFLWDLLDRDKYELLLRDAMSLCDLDDHPAFSLLVQGENDYHWAVKKEDLGQADPPVHGYMLDHETDESRFVYDKLWSNHVSAWGIGFILKYLYISSRGFGFSVKEAGPLLHDLAASFPVAATIGSNHIFATRNVIAILFSGGFDAGSDLAVYFADAVAAPDVPRLVRELEKKVEWRTGPGWMTMSAR